MLVPHWRLIVFLVLGAHAFGEIPRTDDGKPDFSGTYDITSLTPYQRDTSFGETMSFSQDEVDNLKQKAHARVDEAAQSLDPNRKQLSAPEGSQRDRGALE